MERNPHDQRTSKAVRPSPVRRMLERVVNPHGNNCGHSGVDGIIVAEVLMKWMDGATYQSLSDEYGFSLGTIYHWCDGINRPSILAQVEKARRKAGLPIRYTRNIPP